MNKWVQRSIELANGPGYLDRLLKVYPVDPSGLRALDTNNKEAITKAFNSGNDKELIKILLELGKKKYPFPVKDPYVAFLKRDKNALDNNPQTVNRLASRIRKQGLENTLTAVGAEKEVNRQIGPQFSRWLPTLGYPFLPESSFEKTGGITFLEGSGQHLQEYIERKFKPNFNKQPDCVAKAHTTYVIGEAKFLTDYGGHQQTQFNDAITFAEGRVGEALGIAILDGVVWIKSNMKMFKTVSELGGVALSALLFDEFLNSHL
ncbi:restriction endonuclease [candidate division WOR-3 bacterium]|nr:restriction endonuclease [candidate division WOR-3 bacterium]